MNLVITHTYGSVTCPACRDTLMSAPVTNCPRCGIPHHSACLSEGEGMRCSSLNCRPGGTRYTDTPATREHGGHIFDVAEIIEVSAELEYTGDIQYHSGGLYSSAGRAYPHASLYPGATWQDLASEWLADLGETTEGLMHSMDMYDLIEDDWTRVLQEMVDGLGEEMSSPVDPELSVEDYYGVERIPEMRSGAHLVCDCGASAVYQEEDGARMFPYSNQWNYARTDAYYCADCVTDSDGAQDLVAILHVDYQSRNPLTEGGHSLGDEVTFPYGREDQYQTDLIGRANEQTLDSEFGSCEWYHRGEITVRETPCGCTDEPWECERRAVETLAALEDYPILDEDLHSRLEMEHQTEQWNAWGRSEFIDRMAEDEQELLEDRDADVDNAYWETCHEAGEYPEGEDVSFPGGTYNTTDMDFYAAFRRHIGLPARDECECCEEWADVGQETCWECCNEETHEDGLMRGAC